MFTAQTYAATLSQRKEAEREQAMLNDRIREAFSATALAESRLETVRVRQLESEKELAVSQEEAFQARNELNATENKLEFQRKELTSLNERTVRLETESGERQERLRECAARLEQLERRRDAAASENETLQASLRIEEEALTEHQRVEQELLALLEERRKELFSSLSEAAQYKNRLENALKQLAALNERLARHSREEVQLGERLHLARQSLGQLQAEITRWEEELEGLVSALSTQRAREDDLKIRLPERERLWQQRRDELNIRSSRLHSLRELEAQFAGYGQGVKNLMKSGELRQRFGGLLADAIVAPQDVEIALEVVLAEQLQCILCSGTDDALRALDFLGRTKGGRAALALPLNSVPPSPPPLPGTTPLVELVQVAGQHQHLLRGILCRALLTEDLETALRLAPQYPDRIFVTREGEHDHPRGYHQRRLGGTGPAGDHP